MPIKWTPEKKRQYAKERYYRLKKKATPASRKQTPRRSEKKSLAEKPSQRKEKEKSEPRPSLPDSTKIDLTGNPFVDTGLAVIASKSNLQSIDDLNLGDLRAVHKDGRDLAKDAQKLKSFTMIFTRNSLLTQFPKVDPKGVKRENRVKMHSAITCALLNSIGSETEDDYCQACGNEKSVNLSALVNDALAKFDEEPKERFIGRDWFPMAGSLGSDAQALPSASKAPALCAKCLLAVQYLPFGVRLFGRELAVFQSTDTKFWYELVRDIERTIHSQIDQNVYDIFGSKEGRAGLAKQLLNLFELLARDKRLFTLDKETELYVWRFANSTGPNLEVESIPSHALEFLYEVSTKWDLKPEIVSLMNRERVPEERTFFSCVATKKDYYGLYPGKLGKDKGYEGASNTLFYFYQTRILGRTADGLRSAYEIAKIALPEFLQQSTSSEEGGIVKKTKKQEAKQTKEVERLTRKEAFRERKTRSRFHRIMADQTRLGKFSYRMYIELFPYRSGVSVSQEGWNLLQYYFGAAARNREVEFPMEKVNSELSTSSKDSVSKKVYEAALEIFLRYIKERGIERFEKDVLSQLEREKLRIDWLRLQFMRLARERQGFEYDNWKELCHPSAYWTINELYFQFRLLWSEWLRNPPIVVKQEETHPVEEISDAVASSGLPNGIAQKLIDVLTQYAGKRGWDRVERDILVRLQRKEIGLGWFVSKLTHQNGTTITEDDIDSYLRGPENIVNVSERAFQMCLFLDNVYRLRSKEPTSQLALVKVD